MWSPQISPKMATRDQTTQITYRNAWYHRWFPVAVNIAAVLWPIFLCAIVITAKHPIVLSGNDVLSAPLGALFGWLLLVLTANFFPEIRADRKGLSVTFLFLRLPVRWEDIIDIRPMIFSWP